MAKEEKKAPKLRFNGYTNDWERKKLGDVAENLSYGLNLPSTNYDGNNIYLRITDIDDESHTLNRDNLTSPNLGKFDKNILDYKLTENDVVFARTGASVGKTYVYTPTDGNIYFAGFLVRAKFKSSILANFVFYTTLTSKYLNYVKVTSQRSGQPGVNAKEYGNFAISITDSTEQFSIISLLKKLDGTINLHERKCEELALIKKALLQKLFPKKDEFKPEVRYKNFSDAWEQQKLGEVVNLRGRIGFRGYKQTDLVDKGQGAISFSPADIDEFGNVLNCNNKYISWAKYDESPEIQIAQGDILFTKTASIGKIGYITKLREKATINPQIALITPLKNENGYFIFLSLRLDQFTKKVRNIIGGSSVPTLSQEKLKLLTFMYPDTSEQKEIGDFFKQLDSLIALHQRKLEKLKQLKKFLLQNMFI